MGKRSQKYCLYLKNAFIFEIYLQVFNALRTFAVIKEYIRNREKCIKQQITFFFY